MTKTRITGRDGYIVADALATAIVALERLPDMHRPDSNIEDMKAILGSMFAASMVSTLLAQAKCRLNQVRGREAVHAVWREYGLMGLDDEGEAA
jgi:hypothetical protein